MSLVVVRDRQEIYDKLNQTRQSSPHISVRAPGLDEQVRLDLQSEIQAVLDGTLQRARSARPIASTELPSNDQIREQVEAARAQLGSAPSAAPKPRQRSPGKGGIQVATSGLKLAPEDRRAFHSEVRRLVRERLAGLSPGLGGQPAVTVCGCTWPFGGCCWPPAGDLEDLTTLHLTFPPREDESIKVGLDFQGGVETIFFQIWIDPRWATWPPDQILVGLLIDPTYNPAQHAKEVNGWTNCQCEVQIDHQDSATTNYNWMLINQATVDTLSFRSGQFLGWNDCGYFGPTSADFWNVLGGLTLTFDWMWDGVWP
jgi:hypothetical protein